MTGNAILDARLYELNNIVNQEIERHKLQKVVYSFASSTQKYGHISLICDYYLPEGVFRELIHGESNETEMHEFIVGFMAGLRAFREDTNEYSE